MSTRAYTAADLGIDGPHLIAHTIDGERHIVLDILAYETDWVRVDTRERHRTVVHTYRIPGVIEPISGRISPERLTVEGLP